MMKQLFFYLVFFITTIIPVGILVSFFTLCLIVYGSFHKPEIFAKPDAPWMLIVQGKVYYNGVVNVWSSDPDCAIYDEKLLYVPSRGCVFNNPEFTSVLSFDQNGRINPDRTTPGDADPIFVLGDSFAMGWGVNDNETYAYLLEQRLHVPVYNLGVSSYGTVREIKRGSMHPEFDNARCVIIHYFKNDREENVTFLAKGALPSPTKEKFIKLQEYQPRQATPGFVMLKTFEYLKDNPAEIFWFLGDLRRHLYKVFPFLEGEAIDLGIVEAGKVDPAMAVLNTQSHAEIFLDVLEKFPVLSDKTIIVTGADRFVRELREQPGLPDHILPLEIQHSGDDYYYPVDTHFNRIGHEDAASSFLKAFEKDKRFREGCVIE